MITNKFDVKKRYNRENFKEFLSDFLPEDFNPSEDDIFYNQKKNIKTGVNLGECTSLDLVVLEFCTETKRDPRISLTKEVCEWMKKYSYNTNALVVFYSETSGSWRLSLITTETILENSKLKRLYSNPKRFSFKLGEDCKAHTPEQQLFIKGPVAARKENGKDLTAFEDLQSRFALEVVSDAFFKEYKVFYEDFVQYITGNRYLPKAKDKTEIHKCNKEIFNQFLTLANNDYDLACKYVRDYIKKLMGRLVFLQFLQKKGWLGVEDGKEWGSGNTNFILDLFRNSENKDNFLEAVLEPLFFGMLNTKEEERITVFKKNKWESIQLKNFKRVPYLNGGLFEKDYLDNTIISFPKEMFSNEKKPDEERIFKGVLKKYPYTESCGLLDFFARYNFTIDETDPSDMEIGIEPEMLGKIFENLLEDNKDKGAFYTPKEIVQYMCRESLIAYLLTDSNLEESKIRDFVIDHKVNFTDKQKDTIFNSLRNVKICDPAVGSGAFPMGMLNELFACTRLVSDISGSRAELKKHIVKNNIYGVDIEKGAIDIARLRFWLAIIVDEETPLPLPNLDYKIMQGNSLLESYNGIDLSTLTSTNGLELFSTEKEINTLTTTLSHYFNTQNHEERDAHRKAIKEAVYDLLKARNYGNDNEIISKLNDIDLHENNQFFLWHTWFSDVFKRTDDCNKNGFDIVIGNPPYGAKVSDSDKKYFKANYKCAETDNKLGLKGSTDTFTVFIEMGHDMLTTGGNLAFIVPMSVTSSDAMISLHKKIESDCSEIRVSSYSNRPQQIFDAACVRTSIILLKKDGKKLEHLFTTKLIRRNKNTTIQSLIDNLEFVDSVSLKTPGRYAKVGTKIEADTLSKCFSFGKNIGSYKNEKGKPFFYRSAGGRYWNVVANYSTTESSSEKSMNVDFTNLIGLFLSSSVFYFYQQIYTDGLNLKQSEIENFPLPDFNNISKDKIEVLDKLYNEYLIDIEKNANVRTSSDSSTYNVSTFKEYKIVKSYTLIEKIDENVCKLYGLSREETNFIKNYELEARMVGAE